MSKPCYTNQDIARAAHNVRKRVLGLCIDRGGCYLAQACSSAEILNTLYMRILNLGPSLGSPDAQHFPGVPAPDNMDYPKGSLYNGFDYANPDYSIDRLFFSCCHYAVVLYCSLVECGRLSEKAIEKFNVDGWNLEMIGAEHSPGFENTAGSLGQTVSIAAGTAHAYKMKGHTGRIFCMLSDGELQEGQDWECFNMASYYGLDNFIVVADINGQQLEGWTRDNMNIEPLAQRMRAFGWEAVECDGHDIDAIARAVDTPHSGKPLMVLCHTHPDQGMPIISSLMPKHFITVNDKVREESTKFYQSM
ncbi:MAG: transketolase [Clostridia bacterium]|nr:transketolase [Clostridia bacterium]